MNFTPGELALRLGVKTEEMGGALDVQQRFQGNFVSVTAIIQKLKIHIQD